MNYDEARQIQNKETGEPSGWHWTTMNDGSVRTAMPCIRIDEPFDYADPYKPPQTKNIHRCKPHATREEAEQHFFEYCVEQLEEITLANWGGCAICDKPTKTSLGNRGLWLLFSDMTTLCDEHRTKDIFKELHPFHSPIVLIHS